MAQSGNSAPLPTEELDCQNIKSLTNGNNELPLSVAIALGLIAAHRKPPTQEEIDRIEKFLSEFD
jgi:hypothetical protein